MRAPLACLWRLSRSEVSVLRACYYLLAFCLTLWQLECCAARGRHERKVGEALG